jgi:transposase-like protein
MPRARVGIPEGGTTEWRSELVPRYQRRSEQVDAAILGVYLSGTNTRRIKGALAPLLRGGPLSKDAVSRLVGRLADDFETWRSRDLADDHIQYLLLEIPSRLPAILGGTTSCITFAWTFPSEPSTI